jgi:AAA+ ATPase superfamily predicted ATPase
MKRRSTSRHGTLIRERSAGAGFGLRGAVEYYALEHYSGPHNDRAMRFLNRHEELARLNRLSSGSAGALAVIWGRRRIGKTRLLLEWVEQTGGTYWVADQSSSDVQRRYFAGQLASALPGFAEVEYRDWAALFSRMAADGQARGWRGPLVIDELPYLVSANPELASVLQRLVDHELKRAGIVMALSGSSQRMMQGAVLAHDAPLFGRARELFALQPLQPALLRAAVGLSRARDVVTAFAVWGGVPRYWELAESFGPKTLDAANELVLNPAGALHEEPQRLLLEDSAAHLRPSLDAIGAGAHRLSEIASRVGAKATSLSRPLSQLVELGYVRRDVPFGISARDSKRSLYKLDDPFMRLWFRVVAPRRGALAQLPERARRRILATALPSLVSETWEEMCRRATPRLADALGTQYLAAGRFWHGSGPEWDVVARSEDGARLLVGEAKWTDRQTSRAMVDKAISALRAKGVPNSKRGPEQRQYALFIPEIPAGALGIPRDVVLVDASTVLRALGGEK